MLWKWKVQSKLAELGSYNLARSRTQYAFPAGLPPRGFNWWRKAIYDLRHEVNTWDDSYRCPWKFCWLQLLRCGRVSFFADCFHVTRCERVWACSVQANHEAPTMGSLTLRHAIRPLAGICNFVHRRCGFLVTKVRKLKNAQCKARHFSVKLFMKTGTGTTGETVVDIALTLSPSADLGVRANNRFSQAKTRITILSWNVALFNWWSLDKIAIHVFKFHPLRNTRLTYAFDQPDQM